MGVQSVPACGQDWPAGSWFTARSFSSGFDEQCSEKWRGIQRVSPDSKSMPAVSLPLGTSPVLQETAKARQLVLKVPAQARPRAFREHRGLSRAEGNAWTRTEGLPVPAVSGRLVANWEGGSEGLHASPSVSAGRRRYRLSAPITRRPAPAHPGRRRPEATSAPGLGSPSLQASPGLSSSPGRATPPGSQEFVQRRT